MKKHLTQTRNQERARAWIIAKNLFPFAMILLILISLFIPCLRYTTADTGTGETISQWELMGNSWEQSRQYLFGNGEQSSSNTLFCRAVLGTLIGTFISFLLGAVATVLSAAGALYYIKNPEWRGTGRALYLTLFGGRVFSLLWSVLLLPLLTFPRILISFYERYYHYRVLLNVTFPEPMVIGGVLFLLLIGLTVGFAKWEERMGLSPFPKKKQRGMPEASEESDDSPVFDEEEDEMTRRAREEQMERIRRLLDKTEERDASEENEHRNEQDDT